MDFRYAFFDLDGTLSDTMPYWRRVAAETLRFNGISVPDCLEKRFYTSPTKIAFEEMKKILGVNNNIGLTRSDYLRVLVPAYKSKAGEKPHATEFLDYINKKGVICAIATASYREAFTHIIKRFDWEKYFAKIITVEEAGRTKNDSGIFDVLSDYFGAKKSDTVIFEDALYSIKPAVENGYRVVAMYDGTAENDKSEIKNLSEKYIHDYKEIIKGD